MDASSSRKAPTGAFFIILGIIFALLVGIIILKLSENLGKNNANISMTQVITATTNLSTGMVLSSNQSAAPYILISAAVHVTSIPQSSLPPNALIYTSQQQLNDALNNMVVQNTILNGSILRQNDPRLSHSGGPAASLANKDPSDLPAGDVLVVLPLTSPAMQIGAVQGDHIDILATACIGSSGSGSCQVAQTTLQNVYVYAVPDSQTLIVALSHQDALNLKILIETTKISIALRKPDDTGHISTTPVSPQTIYSLFGF